MAGLVELLQQAGTDGEVVIDDPQLTA